MPSSASPYGLLPVARLGSEYSNGGYTEYSMSVDTGQLAVGDPVALIAGTIKQITTSPAGGTVDGKTPIGVFMGVSYNDPVVGFVNRPYVPANAVTAGLTNIKVKVADARNLVFKVQGDAQVSGTLSAALGKVGYNANLTGFNAGNSNTGASGVKVSVSSIATTNTLSVRIVGYESNPGNSPTDAFPDFLVKWNANVHAFDQATGQ